MAFVNDDEIQVRIYPQVAGYKCERFEWVIWRGSEALDRGMVEGSEKEARREAQEVLERLRARGKL